MDEVGRVGGQAVVYAKREFRFPSNELRYPPLYVYGRERFFFSSFLSLKKYHNASTVVVPRHAMNVCIHYCLLKHMPLPLSMPPTDSSIFPLHLTSYSGSTLLCLNKLFPFVNHCLYALYRFLSLSSSLTVSGSSFSSRYSR